jgi:hypothetical protein
MELLFSAPHPEPLWDSLIQRVPWVLSFGGKAGVSMNLTSYLHLGLTLRMRGALSPYPPDASMGIYIMFVTNFIKISLLTADSCGRTVRGTKYLRPFTHGIVGSDTTRGLDVCLRFCCVCVVLYRSRSCDGLIPRPRSPTVCL